jgi:hypothetical protein
MMFQHLAMVTKVHKIQFEGTEFNDEDFKTSEALGPQEHVKEL